MGVGSCATAAPSAGRSSDKALAASLVWYVGLAACSRFVYYYLRGRINGAAMPFPTAHEG
jgi:hypothetical protein